MIEEDLSDPQMSILRRHMQRGAVTLVAGIPICVLFEKEMSYFHMTAE
jgi:hypothetical protein